MGSTRTQDFDFELPPDLIAQAPLPRRDQSRLLVFDRSTRTTRHEEFRAIVNYIRPGDLLVLNNSRVIPARLHGIKTPHGGQIELLLVEENSANDWWVLLKPGKRVRPGTHVSLLNRLRGPTSISAEVLEKNEEGHCRIRFSGTPNILDELDRLGEVPLPPYISRPAQSGGVDDSERYQTVFATARGSVAAPTAGLHFSEPLLQELRDRGVRVHYVTLHVGLGTFAPVKAEFVHEHKMHEEQFELPADTADAITETRARGARVFAVGTTTVRVLESVATDHDGQVVATRGRTRIFIYPPYTFRVVDAMLTNFHLPQSTLLMLVSAFAAPGTVRGRDLMLAAYREAIRERYRFFSYGDAMLIL